MSSISRESLVSFLDSRIDIHSISDSCVNGLQIEGKEIICKISVSVDCGLSVVEEAIEKNTDLLIVHHGIFWGGSIPLVGPMKKLFHSALTHGLSVYAAHLPLDAHQEWGNNFVLAGMLGLANLKPAIPYNGGLIGCIGENSKSSSLSALEESLGKLPGARTPLLSLPFGPAIPQKICIVTGSGSDALWAAKKEGFDTLITGEPRQSCYHAAKEFGVNVIFGGHYATETVGVQAVARAIQKEFNIPWVFLDQPTGI